MVIETAKRSRNLQHQNEVESTEINSVNKEKLSKIKVGEEHFQKKCRIDFEDHEKSIKETSHVNGRTVEDLEIACNHTYESIREKRN